jgi:hypothetical protein
MFVSNIASGNLRILVIGLLQMLAHVSFPISAATFTVEATYSRKDDSVSNGDV